MACFVTPLVAGLVISVLRRAWRNSSRFKLWVLKLMLVGGAIVLAIEHAWHGEISPYPPFLTAMQNPENIPVVIHEITAVGGSMTLAVAAIWLGVLYVSYRVEVRVTMPKHVATTLKTGSGAGL